EVEGLSHYNFEFLVLIRRLPCVCLLLPPLLPPPSITTAPSDSTATQADPPEKNWALNR
ncbi:hypothetical protein PIB30_070627, partial [Stylosanthes scabra]|nr:hypothetical protein [Stylosanthes scabra]